MFECVQHDQRPPARQALGHQLRQVDVGSDHADGFGSFCCNQRGILHLAEGNEEDTLEGVQAPSGNFQRESRLADPARSRQGQQPDIGTLEHGAERLEFL